MKKLSLLLTLITILTACEVVPDDSRDPLLGSWTCKEDGAQAYQVDLTIAPYEEDKMYFDNLYNLHEKVEVLYSGSSFTIPTQTVANFELSGSGTVNDNKTTILLNFTADGDAVSATMTKN